MDFALSGESKMMVKAAKDFALKEIEPVTEKIEREDALPDDLLQKFATARMLGMMVPREYGGIGSSALHVILVAEELAKTASAAVFVMALNNSIAETIYYWGSEDIRQRFIPSLCDGSNYASMAFTEPATGSDPTAITMTAKNDGDYAILNGTKRFITNGHKTGAACFMQRTKQER